MLHTIYATVVAHGGHACIGSEVTAQPPERQVASLCQRRKNEPPPQPLNKLGVGLLPKLCSKDVIFTMGCVLMGLHYCRRQQHLATFVRLRNTLTQVRWHLEAHEHPVLTGKHLLTNATRTVTRFSYLDQAPCQQSRQRLPVLLQRQSIVGLVLRPRHPYWYTAALRVAGRQLLAVLWLHRCICCPEFWYNALLP